MTTKAATSVDLPLTLFGGKDTSLRATDLPEGLSPANNDVVFGPGFVGSRPCLSKLFAAAFPGNPRTVSEHLYTQENGLPLNLYLDSLGVLRQEDPKASPGNYSTVGQVVPGAMMKAVSLDGICYQAFSDGVHGIDIPRRYDGTNWDRLTQEGPAVPPTAADLNSVINITKITGPAALTISRISQNGGINTVITTTAHGLSQGDPVNIAVAAASPFNGSFFVAQVINSTTFTVNATVAATSAAGGTVTPNQVTVTTSAPHGLLVEGDVVSVAGSLNANYNNGQQSTDPVGGTIQNQATWATRPLTATTFLMAVNVGVPGDTTGGTVSIGGLITPGPHELCVAFLTRNGDITTPSPTGSWNCGGGKQVQLTNVAIGPSNVVARIIPFTGSGGANFFWIPSDVNAGAKATVIPDNTSTTAIMDFSDNTLFAAIGADIPGNDLFNQVVLAPCIGVDGYASRLFIWGEFNKVQDFLNMGFEGGTAVVGGNVPLGWDNSLNAGGALVNSPTDFGLAWQITGDGSANRRGAITQSAYQNYLHQQILDVNTQYTFYCWAKASAPNLAGKIEAALFSPSTGFDAVADININTIPNANGAFVSAEFSLPTPATIPSDLVLVIQAFNLPNGVTVTIDEMMLVFTAQPYRNTLMRGSYVNNFAAFDGVTGDIGPTDDPNPILCTFQLLQQLTLITGTSKGRRHVTRDNGGEPGTWEVDQVEEKAGAASINATTTGPNWAMWVSDTGRGLALRITGGGESYKISREMKTDFGTVNMAAKQTVWIQNVDDESRCYIGLPQGNNTIPNVTAVLDYFESDTVNDIAANRPLKIGFTGKMLTTDLGRKWTIWNLPLSCGAILARPDGIEQFVVGSGGTPSFGNAYIFDATKFTDDDYGAMAPSYTTYFFINHEMEQQLPVGMLNKYYDMLTLAIIGTGNLQIVPLANVLTNPVKNVLSLSRPWALSQNQEDDIEFSGLDVRARRCAFTISVTPAQGTTDVNFVLSHLGIRIDKHPVAPQAGVNRSYA